MGWIYNPFTSNFDKTGTASLTASTDRVIVENIPAAIALLSGDLCVFSGGELVAVSDNANTTIPFGVVGFVDSKPTGASANVVVAGTVTGLSGLTAGEPVFVSLLGGLTHAAPLSGTTQLLGFATSATTLALSIKQPLRRS